MTDQNEVSLFLARLVSGSARPLKGSELSVFVKASYPNFSSLQFGCRNLRAFIRQYANDSIAEISRAGMDVVYGPRTGQQQQLFDSGHTTRIGQFNERRGPLDQLLTNPRIWKTFVSPGMPFRLFIDPGSGQIRVLRPEFSPDSSWLEIPRLPGEKLLQIAQTFVSELPESQRGPLAALLVKPKWWIDFLEVARTLGLATRWIAFRRRRIAEEFEQSLPKLSSPEPSKEGLPSSASEAQSGLAAAVLNAPSSSSQLKNVAAEVVQRMTDSELRSLNLPLGYVIDALKTR